MKKVKSIIFGLFLLFACFLVSCGGGGSESSSNKTPTPSSNNSSIGSNPSGDSTVNSSPEEHKHNYFVVDEIIENCEEKMTVVYECECGDRKTVSEPISRDHSYSDWEVVKEPTQYEKGIERRICDVCSYVDEREIDVLEHQHDYYVKEKRDPTCEEEGYTIFECECGDSYRGNVVPALEHVFGEWKIVVEPTFEDGGYAAQECLNNENHRTMVKLPSLNEVDYAYDVYVYPTCEEEGKASYTYVNEFGTFVIDVVLEKTEHEYGKWEVVKKPTFEEKGLAERTCILNKEIKETYELPLLNLNGIMYDPEIIQEATCEEEGLVNFRITVDGEEIIIESEIPAKGHQYTGEIEYISASCEEPSYYKYTCTCGETFLEEGEEKPHGHSYTNNWEVVEIPGSVSEGKAINYCDYDNNHFVEYNLPCTTEGDYQTDVIQERSCAQEGITRYTYYVLGTNDSKISFEIVIEPYSHNYSQTIIQPSCDKEGYTEYLCNECGDYYTDNHIRPYGHDLTYHLYQPSTCEQDGMMEHYYCVNCYKYFLDAYGREEVSEDYLVIKASGHNFKPWKVVKTPTLSEPGRLERICWNDSYVDVAIIDQLNKDTYEYELVRESNCLDSGLERYTWVEDGEEIVFEIHTPAHDHDYLPWEVVEAPTLSSEGSIKSVCKYDEEHYIEATLPILSESEYEYTLLVAPTCEESGLANYYYFYMNTEFNFEVEVDPLNHAYGEWTVDVTPTKEEAGSLIRRCGNNEEHYETHDLPVLNEKDYVYALISDSTCLENGLEQYAYAINNQIIVIDSYIPMKNHEPSEINLYDENNHWDKCDCGTAYNIEEHDFVDGYCSVCGVHESIKLLTFQISNYEYYQVYDCNEEATYIEIPATYKGLPVDHIQNGTFINCDKLESIVIPKTLSFRYAYDYFKHCPNLTNVYFKGNVVDWCNMEMQGIQFVSEDLHLFFYEDGEYVEVIDLVIPEGVTSINEKQFAYFNNIKTVVIPSTVETIGNYAFYKNNKLTSVEINEGASLIGRYAFFECSSLEKVNIPSTVKEIGEHAFNKCVSLNELVISEGLEIIGRYAFYNNDGLYTLSLPESLITIDYSAFEDCDNLVNILIPSNVESIGSGAFISCDNIETVNILNKDCSISSNMFKECYKIIEMRLPIGTKLTFDDIVSKDIKTLKKVTLTGGTYIEEEYFRNFTSIETVVLSVGLEEIGSYAFSGMTSLTSVNIPTGVTTIDFGAFFASSALKTIILPDTLTTLGSSAFEECTSLETIVLSQNLISIESYAFKYCINLSSIDIPSSVEFIGASAFAECEKLETVSISIDSKITSIGNYAFDNCKLLKKIYLPSTLTIIKDSAFRNCHSLEMVTFGSNCDLTTIENYAFYNCVSLKSINLGECILLETIPSRFLYQSSLVEEIVIPANVKLIEDNAFRNFDGQLSFAEGSKLETIEDYAFYKLKQRNLALPNSLVTIESRAFSSVIYDHLILPDGIKYIGDEAFGYARKVTLPDSVEDIRNDVFNGLKYDFTTDVYYQGSLEQLLSINYCSEDDLFTKPFTEKTTIYIDNQKISGDVVIDTLPVIPGCLFANSDIESVTINSQITRIDEGAFYNCRKLASINLENQESLEKISKHAFVNCIPLTRIYIPNTVSSIEDYSIENCPSLSEIEFEDNSSLKEIGYYIFNGLYSLYSIKYPEGAESIQLSLSGCDNLMSVTIPSTVTKVEIGSYYASVVEVFNKSSVEINFDLDALVNVFNEEKESSLIFDNDFVYVENGDEYIIARYVGKDSLVIIPETFNGKPCTISKLMLSHNDYVDIVVIPAASGYGLSDFEMSYLEDIIRAEDYEKFVIVDDYLVKTGNPNIIYKYLGDSENLVLPETILEKTYKIEEYAFVGNKTLKSISFPAEASSISYVDFKDCENLVSVTIEEGSGVYLGSFENCYSLTTLPSTNYQGTYSYTSSNRFKNCYSLTTLTITDGLTDINPSSFMNCYNLKSISLPETVKYLGREAFRNCYNLTSIVIPSKVTRLNDAAFYNCINLRNVKLNEGLVSIGSSVFYNCGLLTSITLPSTVETIENSAFSKTSLETIKFAENSKIKTIGQNVFTECSYLETITLPEGLETIDYRAFYNCTRLKSIKVPSTVTYVGHEAFYGCASLTSAIILGNITSLENSTFENCYQLSSVTLPDSITKIYSKVFMSAYKLKEINLPKELTSIGYQAFSDCYLLEGIEFSDKLEKIDGFAFSGCKGIKEIKIPASVTTLGTGSFQNYGVSKVVFEENSSITTLGSQAINTYLDVLVLPTSITSVAGNAFTMKENSKIFYYGTSEEWGQITFKSSNTTAKATVYYYSEETPSEEGNFWHFADDGETIIIW